MRMVGGLTLMAVAVFAAKTPTKKAVTVKSAKPAKSAKSVEPTRPVAKSAEVLCQEAWERGDLPTLRRKCIKSAAGASDNAGSLYWGSLVATDPSVLRKTLSATHLKLLDSLDSRLLLLAGRYQFSVGEVREVQDLAWLAAKRKLKDARIDTLKRLAEGK